MHLRKSNPSLSKAIDQVCACLSIATVFGLIIQHLYTRDPSRCEATLTGGRWLDSSEFSLSNQTFQNWQPEGCMLHQYQAKDIQACLGGHQIVYIGDSTIRQLFWATARKIDPEPARNEQFYAELDINQMHADRSYEKNGVKVQFIWDPFLNSSTLPYWLQEQDQPSTSNVSEPSTAIILVGGGLWHARHLGEAYIQRFSEGVGNVSTTMFPIHKFEPQADSILKVLSPMHVPWYSSLNEARRNTITPSKVQDINEHLLQLSMKQGTPIAWAFSFMSHEQPATYDTQGIHVSQEVAFRKVDILLNMRCNTVLMHRQAYPMDQTCCLTYPTPNQIQLLILIGLVTLILIGLVRRTYSSKAAYLPSPNNTEAIALLALVLWYCYLADRTQYFAKAQKYFFPQQFAASCVVAAVAGVISIRRSIARSSSRKEASPTRSKDQLLLSRDQTDEWKGWMQVLILAYHFTGGSRVLPIYELIRLLVSSYLFMTGFGHAMFFIKKADYSLKRNASVLIRLNLLSVALPYVMRTVYLFYYFAPLVSFWYIVTYLTMYAFNQRNYSLTFVTCKIFVSAALINFIIRQLGTFETLFYLLERCCAIHWNVEDWRFRLQLDGYIVYVGMLSGLLFIKIIDALQDDRVGDGRHLNDFIRKHFRKARVLAVLWAVAVPPTFYYFAARSDTKFQYNAYVPYVSAFPIISFIILRNSSRLFRNFYSTAFAWIGKISLETFTLQFHIWLAADTRGQLRLGIPDAWGGKQADFMLLSIMFLWACKKVSAATQTLTNWIVDPNAVKEDEDSDSSEKQNDVLRSLSVGKFPTITARVLNALKSWTGSNLRVRLLLILLSLWVLNLTY